MITRQQIHELAELDDQNAAGLSFFYQPATPRNKAHKEEAILTKDLVREAQRKLEGKEKPAGGRADLDRIARLWQELRERGMRSSGGHGKAVFACAGQGFWREYDLPAHEGGGTQLFVDRHFHMKPLVESMAEFPSLGVVLVDRRRARFFDLHLSELTEREGFFHPLSRRGRSDGFGGYDAGHAERRVEEETREHFKFVADFMKDALEKQMFANWILGCQETHWPQFEKHLHPYAAEKLLGRFSTGVKHMGREEICEQAGRIFREAGEKRCRETVQETIDQARHNARGVTGLRRVLHSLLSGEVQTLLVGNQYHAQAVECSGCGHLDAHLVSFCPICGRETRTVVDVGEAILPWALRQDIEIIYVKDDAEFDKVGNIAALLRFRSQKGGSNVRSIADLPPNPSVSRPAGRVGRYRGLASG
jgi:peptide subunit release factor 1 (eRF1)